MTPTSVDTEADQFWEWFRSNADSLLQRPPTEVVDLVVDRLHAIDAELSAEVSGFLEDNSKELVLTSHGQPSWFEFIFEFRRRAPEIPHWRIRALKPPRGFDFTVASNPGLTIRDWMFVPLKRSSEFAEFGVRIEMSNDDYDLVDGRTVASIVEEGIGEVLLSVCAHIEFDIVTNHNSMPIGQLCEAVHAWCMVHGPNAVRKFLPAIQPD